LGRHRLGNEPNQYSRAEAFEIFGDKSEYVVAAPQNRAAANTAMGWLSRSRAQ
jgi:hypothetical protein